MMEEKKITFQINSLGLVVLENRLKPDTTAIIHQILEANVRTIMVTGKKKLKIKLGTF